MTVAQQNKIRDLRDETDRLKDSIKSFCLECVGGSENGVAQCSSPKCALFDERPFKRLSKRGLKCQQTDN